MNDSQRHQRKLYMRRYRMTAVEKASQDYQDEYYQANKEALRKKQREYYLRSKR